MLELDADFTVYCLSKHAFNDSLVLGYYVKHGSSIPVDIIDSVGVRIVHAPGAPSVRASAGATQIEVSFGLLPDTYQGEPKTDVIIL